VLAECGRGAQGGAAAVVPAWWRPRARIGHGGTRLAAALRSRTGSTRLHGYLPRLHMAGTRGLYLAGLTGFRESSGSRQWWRAQTSAALTPDHPPMMAPISPATSPRSHQLEDLTSSSRWRGGNADDVACAHVSSPLPRQPFAKGAAMRHPAAAGGGIMGRTRSQSGKARENDGSGKTGGRWRWVCTCFCLAASFFLMPLT